MKIARYIIVYSMCLLHKEKKNCVFAYTSIKKHLKKINESGGGDSEGWSRIKNFDYISFYSFVF